MSKGRTLVLVCLLVLSALPATAQGDSKKEQLAFDEANADVSLMAQAVETGFQIETVFAGLSLPTVVRFSPDGRIFVAEKGGAVKVFDSFSDTTPTTVVNVSSQVYSYWDRGLLGMALHPNFPASPYLYLLFALDTRPYGDTCPTPPGPTTDGCMANGRLLKIQVNPDNTSGTSTELLTGGFWCQQFPSHSTGSLEIGPEGALYVSAGDGASFNVVDYGQLGGSLSGTHTPQNPCADPLNEGGALRSQDARTTSDPLTYDGTVLRINPDTGAAWQTNPLSGGDPADDAILAYGLRNPFRMTVANNGDLYVGDVGWGTWEEINRLPSGAFANFGWPCYEGTGRQNGYDGANVPVCETLYGTPSAVTPPLFTYRHGSALKSCPEVQGNSSAITGLAFYPGGAYPNNYDGSLFFADYSRGCIWVMFLGANGQPSPNDIVRFVNEEPSVGLYSGPGGDIYSIDHIGGRVRRFRYVGGINNPPVANASAAPLSGTVPLTVSFSSSGSSDPDNDILFYAWDLDGDGGFDDAFIANPSFTYNSAGTYQTRLQVSDGQGGSDMSDPVTITATATQNQPPVATITSPTSILTWGVGQTISLAADANDDAAGLNYSWLVTIVHCSANVPTDCHEHVETTLAGQNVNYVAPDHDYPTRLRFDLTVTDAGGLTDQESVEIQARSVLLTLKTSPGGFATTIGGSPATSLEVIASSRQTIAVVTPQSQGGFTYAFRTWNDGTTSASRTVTVASSITYTATYNGLPTAALTASPTSGPVGTTVNFTASGNDVDGTYAIAWDTDNDGQFDDGSGLTRSIQYGSKGNYTVRILVTDNHGATATASVTVQIKPAKGGRR
ncbi:PQQ-dependent sugar dehydrogenase [soil metagenome]